MFFFYKLIEIFDKIAFMRNLNMPQNSFVQVLFYGPHLLKFDFCQILSHFNKQILRCRRLFTLPMKVNKTGALILLLFFVFFFVFFLMFIDNHIK